MEVITAADNEGANVGVAKKAFTMYQKW